MGAHSKTIALQVPSELVYQYLKDKSYLDYVQDLLQGQGFMIPRITKDIPNSLYGGEASSFGTKVEFEYRLKSLGEDSCEITIEYRYSLAFEFSIRQSIMAEIQGLKGLELGYKAGLQKQDKTQ